MTIPLSDLLPLLLLAVLLGARHGLDADHLAAIDGLTRYNHDASPRRARWCGTLFSLGHGLVVLAIAVAVAAAAGHWEAPVWLDATGGWISFAMLSLLGLANLRAVLRTPAGAVVRPQAIKGRFFARWARVSHPVAVAAVGALFALSFDTLSQAALYASGAGTRGGAAIAGAQAMAFLLGMLAVDGANGLWIARLIGASDRRARLASRIMGLCVALLSFTVALLGLASRQWPDAVAVLSGRELWISAAVMATVATSFLLAVGATRRVAARGAH